MNLPNYLQLRLWIIIFGIQLCGLPTDDVDAQQVDDTPQVPKKSHISLTASCQFPEARLELLEIYRTEQYLRGQLFGGRHASRKLSGAIESTDRYHADRLEAIIDEIGWPTTSKVGVDGSHAAWSIVQHAVFNPPLMRRCLQLMKPHFGTAEISGVDFAYLTDRFAAVSSLEQQEFGIVRGVIIRDEHELKPRRLAAGFETEYPPHFLSAKYQPPTAEAVVDRDQKLAKKYAAEIAACSRALEANDHKQARRHIGNAMECRGLIQTEDIYTYARLIAGSDSPRSEFQTIQAIRILAARGFSDVDRLEQDPSFANMLERPLWKEVVEVIVKYNGRKSGSLSLSVED